MSKPKPDQNLIHLARELARQNAEMHVAMDNVVRQVSGLTRQLREQNAIVNRAIDSMVDYVVMETDAASRSDWQDVKKTVETIVVSDLTTGALEARGTGRSPKYQQIPRRAGTPPVDQP